MIIIFRSEYWGAGKTVAGLSFYRPNVTPKRLVWDPEQRAVDYKSPDNSDHIDKLQFAFDFWPSTKILVNYITELAKQINDGKFLYNAVIFDNATLFQEELRAAVQTEAAAMQLTNALGCTTALMSGSKKFNVNDTANYYYILKGIIGALLRKLRQGNVDVIVTSESKNVWLNYGKRGYDPVTNEPFMKIVGQTAKLWDPWFQYGDAVFNMSRISGDRLKGEGKISPYPTVTIDTFNPKCSIPGIAPSFTLNNWGVFWDMVERRRIPTAEDFAKIEVPGAAFSIEAEEITREDAIRIITDYAVTKKVLASSTPAERKRLATLGKEHGLDPTNILVQYDEWLAMVDEVSNASSK